VDFSGFAIRVFHPPSHKHTPNRIHIMVFMPSTSPSCYFNISALIFLNFYMRRINFTNETCQKNIISIFLTLKATILDTRSIINTIFSLRFKKETKTKHYLNIVYCQVNRDKFTIFSIPFCHFDFFNLIDE